MSKVFKSAKVHSRQGTKSFCFFRYFCTILHLESTWQGAWGVRKKFKSPPTVIAFQLLARFWKDLDELFRLMYHFNLLKKYFWSYIEKTKIKQFLTEIWNLTTCPAIKASKLRKKGFYTYFRLYLPLFDPICTYSSI